MGGGEGREEGRRGGGGRGEKKREKEEEGEKKRRERKMPVLLTVPCKVIVAAGALAANDASGALRENVSAFREGLPDRPNISNAL